jgi:hypothetical protein
MPMGLRHAKPADSLSFEIELDQHRRLVSHDPPLVPGVDRHNLWGNELRGAAVGILNVNLASGQKPHVGVHAEIGAHDTLHVAGPTKSRRIHDTLDAAAAGSHGVDPGSPDFTVFGPRQGSE